MTELLTVENLIAFLTLTSLEIVLGIDNIVLIAVLTSRLPHDQQPRARRLGLLGAMIMRILLLLAISWIMRLTKPLFSIGSYDFTGQELILLIGGLFLIGKATHEIHDKLEGPGQEEKLRHVGASFVSVISQIMALDIVFSLDSVITAVGMVKHIPIMIAAVIVSVAIMLIFAGPISGFIMEHPTIKMLALSFLMLIGVLLVAEGLGQHIPKGYVYFAMAFSLVVEMLNLRVIKHHHKSAAPQPPSL